MNIFYISQHLTSSTHPTLRQLRSSSLGCRLILLILSSASVLLSGCQHIQLAPRSPIPVQSYHSAEVAPLAAVPDADQIAGLSQYPQRKESALEDHLLTASLAP